MKTKQEVSAIITALKALYPDAQCSLDYGKDYELLFSVRLAAQCTDARVNLVTPALFARYPTLEAFAEADVDEVGQYIHSCGFWRAKARDIVASARMLREAFGGRVPDTMEQLLRLPGVGRKTANLVLGDIYGQEGYVCDTHCIRITGRLGLTDGSKDPLKVERLQGPYKGGDAASEGAAPGGVQQLLPPDGAPWTGRLHRPLSQVRGVYPAALL